MDRLIKNSPSPPKKLFLSEMSHPNSFCFLFLFTKLCTFWQNVKIWQLCMILFCIHFLHPSEIICSAFLYHSHQNISRKPTVSPCEFSCKCRTIITFMQLNSNNYPIRFWNMITASIVNICKRCVRFWTIRKEQITVLNLKNKNGIHKWPSLEIIPKS